MPSSRPVQRSATASSSGSDDLYGGHGHNHAASQCSCGNPLHGKKKKGSNGNGTDALPSPSKGISSVTSIRRQRELREYAAIDKLLSRIFFLRFYEDAARLYSTRLTLIAKERLPYLIQNIIAAGAGPGWACINAASDEIREFFRLQIQVDFRELEDRIYHISSEWTYTAIRRMAITNGVNVSPAGLRASDLLKLVPLLEAMCKGLENAPQSAYEIHPVRAIAGTFVNLPCVLSMTPATSLLSPAGKKKIIVNHKMQEIPSLCSHHPTNKCALDAPESPAWGPSLHRIASSALRPDPKTPSSAASLKSAAASSPASMLFDALFPPSPKRSPISSKAPSTPGSAKVPGTPFTESEITEAQSELRSILSLGLSRLFIVLFQTAQEFNIRSFGENVNLAFGASTAASFDEDQYYGGCECCLEDFYNDYSNQDRAGGNGYHHDDPLYELWHSVTSQMVKNGPYGSPGPAQKRRKSSSASKRSRMASSSSSASLNGLTSGLAPYMTPYTSERSAKAAFYKGVFCPRPGAGLRAWDTVLHYEAVIREEEEEKLRKEEEKRLEKAKYGLKGNSPVTPTSKALLQKTGTNTLKESVAPLVDPNGMDIDDSQDAAKRKKAGKAREGVECDGRGGGLVGWNSCHEEDVWERDLDSTDDFGMEDYFGFQNNRDEDMDSCRCRRVAMRYLVAEEYKEDGNLSFKRGDYQEAVDLYTAAHKSEPRLPIYLLNRAMAELKLNRWDEAEMDCTAVLRKHRTNAKALWRRAKARRSLAQLTGHIEKLIAAEQDLLDFLVLLPTSAEGHVELASVRAELCPCFECTEQFSLVTTSGGDPSVLFCSTSSAAPPRSCFNKNYRPAAYYSSGTPQLSGTPLSRSADVLTAPPRGWQNAPPMPAAPASAGGKKSTTPLSATGKGQGQAWSRRSPNAGDPVSWKAYAQDFSATPPSCHAEDRMPLRFVSDHDIANSTLPAWDFYRVVKSPTTPTSR